MTEEVRSITIEIKKDLPFILPGGWEFIGFTTQAFDQKQGVLSVAKRGLQGRIYLTQWKEKREIRQQELSDKLAELEKTWSMAPEEASRRIRELEALVQDAQKKIQELAERVRELELKPPYGQGSRR